MKPALNIEVTFHRMRKHYDAFQESAKEFVQALDRETALTKSVLPQIAIIQTTVAGFFSLPHFAMTTLAKPVRFTTPRQIAMMLSRELTNLTLDEISSNFGGRTHTSVMYAIESVAGRCEHEKELREQVNFLRQKCRDALPPEQLPLSLKSK